MLTYYWPPAGGSGVQRWLKFVKYMPEFGLEPLVFTVENPDYPIQDPSLMEEVRDVEVVRAPMWEPQGWLKLLGSNKSAQGAGFLKENPGLMDKVALYIRANFFIPDARKFWLRPALKRLEKVLQKENIDCVISTGPPHSVHLIAQALKVKYGLKWVADFRDPWTEIDYFHQLPLSKSALEKHRRLEKMVLETADQILVVGQSMKASFEKINPKVEVVTNGYDDAIDLGQDDNLAENGNKAEAGDANGFRENVNEVETARWDEQTLVILHAGLMNADRNPKVLWKAMTELREKRPELFGALSIRLIGQCAPEVKQSLDQLGLTDKVSFEKSIPYAEVQRAMHQADVLLISVNKVASAPKIITGKVFEYLQTLKPILAIGPKGGDLSELLGEAGQEPCIDFEDLQGMTARLESLIEAKMKGQLGSGDKEAIGKFHRKELTAELAKILFSLAE